MELDVEADIVSDLYIHALGPDYNLDFGFMEQTIIDDVMSTISTHSTMPEEATPNLLEMKSHSFERCPSLNVKNNCVESCPPLKMKSLLQDSGILQKPVEAKKECIEATDVGSLLEQFEEASQGLDSEQTSRNNGTYNDNQSLITFHSAIESEQIMDSNGNVEKTIMASAEHLQNVKPNQKPKTAVMLPMMVPAKRGRGRAMTRGHPVAMPTNCTPRRLQRIMMQNSSLKDSHALFEEQKAKEIEAKSKVILKVKDCAKVIENYISMKKEKTQLIEKETEQENVTVVEEKNVCEQVNFDHGYSKMASNTVASNDNKDCEDGEIVVDDFENEDRNRRKRDNSENDGQFFDKIPSYYTALSIPRKQIRKTASCAYGRGGIAVHDHIESRAISPVRDTSAYNKLPEYFSSFTNSTKYDSVNESDQVFKSMEESKTSSGYSSREHSPAISTSSCSKSGSRSPSGSCHSRSPSRNRSRSCHRSRSNHERPSRSVERSYRQRRQSYSSCSGYSSSGSSVSCSGCSRSSCGRSSSCSSVQSCSSCDSPKLARSRSRSGSSERAWSREQRFRSDRSRQDFKSPPESFSRSRSRSRKHRRSGDPHYRSRSRSCSKERRQRALSRERRQEEMRLKREEEKQQQMKDRRIVYVGGIPNSYTRHQLRNNFSRFGDIENVQLHFRECGDNYGFVTFTYTCDAFAAIERGKKIPELRQFDLCFGGRRQFCDIEYADLDGNKEVEEEYDSAPKHGGGLDFDALLRQAQAKIKKS
ncbi:peroxisome proliferator-activated receptor gamma coactivator 1-alpha-like isoform X2 [Mya arenaria]|uniref:peroxisome proliferator-activated receptor gamma coactivator 1-alpha-like isoform X2 n=1 Tax=Mya arenaria TaxID=6604 RepID=UPI0022E924C7|nr:peroxisome proliferator-activated receptor gamma coactivator 1-alpha-like isoform X2 [Mya arenaria]